MGNGVLMLCVANRVSLSLAANFRQLTFVSFYFIFVAGGRYSAMIESTPQLIKGTEVLSTSSYLSFPGGTLTYFTSNFRF